MSDLGRFIAQAQAHCDVPCGIYDPATAQIAAHSVARFLDQIAELPEAPLDLESQARLVRLVAEKESHAAEVKAAIVVIWGDYFKAPHFDAHPELHELTHRILMTASACKQETQVANGRLLVDLVNDFAEIFWATKQTPTERVTAKYKPNLDIVRPA